MVVSETGATANLARFRWLEHRNRFLEGEGYQKVSTYRSSARFRFGDVRLGGVRHAVDIPVRIAGSTGEVTAFALGANIPALLREGAFEALEGQLDFPRDLLTLRKRGATIPLRATSMSHYILIAVDSGEDPLRKVKGSGVSASYF